LPTVFNPDPVGPASSSPPLNLSARIPELDGLRGLAIGMVLLYHYFQITLITRPGSLLAYLQVLARHTWSGVDLFFVLSGFLIGGILLDARAATNYFKIFYTRRFFRIIPIYAVVLLATWLAESVGRWVPYGDFRWVGNGSLPWYSYATLTQNFWMAWTGTLGALALTVTWSLAVEEQFYLTLPFVVRFVSVRRLRAVVLAGICAAPLLRIGLRFLWPQNLIAGYRLMPCRADALLLGVLAAILLRDDSWRARIQRNNAFFAISITVLLLGTAFLTLRAPSWSSPLMTSVGYTWLALFYVVLLLYAVTRPTSFLSRALRLHGLAWLGSIAYGAYLLHQGVLFLLFGFLWRQYPQIAGGYTALTAFAALGATLLAARLSWRFFENPLIRFGHRSRYTFAEPISKALPQSATEAVCP
jgi:peptidoglycan/LPS O-acetylase OafA/YrhL